MFQWIYGMIMTKRRRYLAEDSGWIIDSVIKQNIYISKCKRLTVSSYINLPKKLNHSRKGLINIQSTNDNNCLKCCLVTYLNTTDHYLTRIRKIYKDFARGPDFKNIKFLAKIRDVHKIGGKICVSISV